MSRRRRRASDIAPVRPTRGLGSLVLLAIALALVILYKISVSEETAGFFTQITGDPELVLPPSVLDRIDAAVPEVGAPAVGAPEAAPALADAAADTSRDAAPDARPPD